MNYKIESANKEKIVARLRAAGIAYWQIAEVMGVHPQTVLNRMRRPTDEFTEKMIGMIEEIEHGKVQ